MGSLLDFLWLLHASGLPSAYLGVSQLRELSCNVFLLYWILSLGKLTAASNTYVVISFDLVCLSF